MASGLTIFIFISLIVVIGLVAFIVYLYNKEEKIKEDEGTVINMAEFKSGRAIGSLRENFTNDILKRSRITLKPQDLSYKTRLKKMKVNDINIIANNNMVIPFPKGTWSKEKNIYWLLPNKVEKLKEQFAETPFGKIIAFMIEYKNADEVIKSSMRKGIERMSEYIDELGDGEASSMVIKRFRDILKEIDEMYKLSKTTKPIGGEFPRPEFNR